MDIDLLRYQIATCHRCPLGDMRDRTGTVSVPADPGSRYADGGLAIFAEAPGANESREGKPMAGASGRQLAAILEEAGLSRDDLLIVNRIRCRPPNNKIRSKEGIAAIAACDEWLRAELAAYNPGVVLLMGGTALELLFGKVGVGKIRGTVRTTGEDFPYGARTWVATAHPAAILHGDAHWLPLIIDDMRTAHALLRSRRRMRVAESAPVADRDGVFSVPEVRANLANLGVTDGVLPSEQ